jgi:hypothetical protein
MRRLSEPQMRFLDAVASGDDQPPVISGRKGITFVSAWWRTFESLERLGLVEPVPYRCFRRPRLTPAGVNARAFAVVASPREDGAR